MNVLPDGEDWVPNRQVEFRIVSDSELPPIVITMNDDDKPKVDTYSGNTNSLSQHVDIPEYTSEPGTKGEILDMADVIDDLVWEERHTLSSEQTDLLNKASDILRYDVTSFYNDILEANTDENEDELPF